MTSSNKIIMFNTQLHPYQIISMIGLFPFGLLFIMKNSVIGLIIFINGLWYWSRQSLISYVSDITYNTLSIIYVNSKTSWQPKTFYWTLIAISIWMLNFYNKNNIINSIIHVIFVQWILAYCLLK